MELITLKKNVLFLLIAFFIVSCTKTGPEGPAGVNGNTILTGLSDPTPSIGVIGDFYINLETTHLFGPKDASGWNDGISLRGEPGAVGESGATILNGTTSPNTQQGKIGDFFLNIVKMDFFGPKTIDGWGTPITLAIQKDLEKRVLVKTNFGYSKNCEICTQYVPAGFTSLYSVFTANSAMEVIKPGDISEYFDKGFVIYEFSINNGEWVLLDTDYSKPITHNFKINNREYYTTIYPNQITYSKTQQELKIGMEREIRVPSLYSKEQLMEWLDNDLKINIKITLLPKENIEYLSRTNSNNKIYQISF